MLWDTKGRAVGYVGSFIEGRTGNEGGCLSYLSQSGVGCF